MLVAKQLTHLHMQVLAEVLQQQARLDDPTAAARQVFERCGVNSRLHKLLLPPVLLLLDPGAIQSADCMPTEICHAILATRRRDSWTAQRWGIRDDIMSGVVQEGARRAASADRGGDAAVSFSSVWRRGSCRPCTKDVAGR